MPQTQQRRIQSVNPKQEAHFPLKSHLNSVCLCAVFVLAISCPFFIQKLSWCMLCEFVRLHWRMMGNSCPVLGCKISWSEALIRGSETKTEFWTVREHNITNLVDIRVSSRPSWTRTCVGNTWKCVVAHQIMLTNLVN